MTHRLVAAVLYWTGCWCYCEQLVTTQIGNSAFSQSDRPMCSTGLDGAIGTIGMVLLVSIGHSAQQAS